MTVLVLVMDSIWLVHESLSMSLSTLFVSVGGAAGMFQVVESKTRAKSVKQVHSVTTPWGIWNI